MLPRSVAYRRQKSQGMLGSFRWGHDSPRRRGAAVRTGAYSGISVSRWRQATLLALFALLLIPINYRAGAAVPHGHALIQLIFEARSGIPVHHHGVDQMSGDHGSDVASSHAGAPPVQIFAASALLPMIVIALALQTLRPSILLTSDSRPAGRSVRPAHPPPRSA